MNARVLPSKSVGLNSSVLRRPSVVSPVATSFSFTLSILLSSSVASFDLMDTIGVRHTSLTKAQDMQWMACSIQHAHHSLATYCIQVGLMCLTRMAIALSHMVEPSAVPQPSLSGSTRLSTPPLELCLNFEMLATHVEQSKTAKILCNVMDNSKTPANLRRKGNLN